MKDRSFSPHTGAESHLPVRNLGLSREQMPRVILRKPIAAELHSYLKLLTLLRSYKRCCNFQNYKLAVSSGPQLAPWFPKHPSMVFVSFKSQKFFVLTLMSIRFLSNHLLQVGSLTSELIRRNGRFIGILLRYMYLSRNPR
jgi:hypothetical protein